MNMTLATGTTTLSTLLAIVTVACGMALAQVAAEWTGPYTPKDLEFLQRMLIVVVATFVVRLILNWQNGFTFQPMVRGAVATAIYGPAFLLLTSPFAPVLSNSATIGLDYLAALLTGTLGHELASKYILNRGKVEGGKRDEDAKPDSDKAQ